MTDDVKFIANPTNKWLLGKNHPDYTGFYSLQGTCFCHTPRCLTSLFQSPEPIKMFALREFMELKLGPRHALPWNQNTPFFDSIFSRGIGTIEREIEMLKSYIYPRSTSYSPVFNLNLGIGCDNTHFGGVNSTLPNHVF